MGRITAAAVVFCLCLAGASVPAHAIAMNQVILQGLDKVTARVTTIVANVGQVVKFGTLEIIARHCDKRPPEEPPESAAFLDIWETRPGEPAVSLFRGWMFASSPALNALEHPVYDIWVKDCRQPADATPPNQGTPPIPAPTPVQQ